MQTKMFNLGLFGALVLSSVSAFASDATSASGNLDLVKAHKGLFASAVAIGAGAAYLGSYAWDRHHAPKKAAAAKKASDEARVQMEAEVRASLLKDAKKDAPPAPGQAPAAVAAPAVAVAAAPADDKIAQEELTLDRLVARRTQEHVQHALASEQFGNAAVGALTKSKQLKELLDEYHAKLRAEFSASNGPKDESEDGDELEEAETTGSPAPSSAGAAASPSASAAAAAATHPPVKAKKAKKAGSVPSDAKEISEKKDLKDKSKASDKRD